MQVHRFVRALALSVLPAVVLALPGSGVAEEERPQAPAPLGTPDHLGFAVADIDAALRRLRTGTGNRFTPVRTTWPTVTVPGSGSDQIEMRRARSTRDEPHIELVASPAAGPWKASADKARPFLSYTVADVDASGARLSSAGFKKVAHSAAFSFWEGIGGILVQLIEDSAAPQGADPSAQPAPLDLGRVRNISILPCAPGQVKTQLTAVTGQSWNPPDAYDMPWTLADGSQVNVHETVELATSFDPYVGIVTQTPAMPYNACTDTGTPFYPVFLTFDVPAATTQLKDAGFRQLARVDPVVSLMRAEGISIEIAHVSFLP